ncbi:myosin phosphatase Rho-interacting protein isoform X1 [Astyanax mexicanus]|uniref:myosin phosphatase Rho-interacting protein isoform X1 n=1 Tax=Astyanax mexicanus TaxID=7994 RepID=UPI0020CAC250|nr:myosin phosphatase Rho-interacting protein isoform X1 [Astyanax mexicanus]
MSTAKENPCRKFQANIFNKSKCQNCFKPRELHLLTDQDLNQAKPIYGGWLCLAPEGTDFDNPMHRSRKWQRRFFVLYEHGCLRFALDESPSTLPQGTVNMNLCTDVIDAEPKTGQKNALCIITPDQEYYIRGDNKEIINGWSEQLVVYPRTNKQNQKKKRKVEPTTSQEPGPAKVAVTGSGIPEAEKVPDSSSIIWQEELHNREADVAQVWASTEMSPQSAMLPSAAEEVLMGRGSDQGSVNGDEVDRSGFSFPPVVSHPPQDLLSPTGSSSSRHSGELGGIPRCLSPAPSDPFPSGSSLLSNGSHISGSMSSLDSDASGSTVTSTESHPAEPLGRAHRALHDPPYSRRLEGEARKAEKRSRLRSPERQNREPLFSPERSGRSNVIEKLEALELENAERMEVEETSRGETRQGRSETRRFQRQDQKLDQAQGVDFHHSTLPPLRRAKSLDRRTTESVMTPDLLNFKKGWMVKLDEQGQWKKYWFVLTDHSLRYYKDSIAEEASDLDGEIDLSTCYNVTEYQAQRNYGFQIHTQEGVHTLSAMTAGIRRNWIQAVMKNVRPSTAPDVASLTDDHAPCGPFESLVRPDITQDSPSSETSSVEREPKKSRARERRREGRSKTFDWAEFRPIAQALAQQRVQEVDALQAQLADPERNKRREERRRRYESVTGSSSFEPTTDNSKMDFESVGVVCPPSPERQQKVEDEIEQRWQQVEKTPIREERRVPLATSLQNRDSAELEKLLENYKKGVEDLKSELETCYQHLADSNHHKLELEDQLKAALEREHQIRAGYISPLESPLSLETKPQMKRPELVSSQAQSLTKKYQETKELLQLQELKKRNMQAQLGLSLSHLSTTEPHFSDTTKTSTSETLSSAPIKKAVTLVLLDDEGKIRELEDLIDVSKPLSVKEVIRLLFSHSDSVLSDFPLEKNELDRSGDITKCHELLECLKNQQEIENETVRKSLAKAGDSIRNYEARLITMEDMLGRVQRQEGLRNPCTSPCQRDESTQMTNRGLSQRVEILTSENEALNQRYQEIVNQMREADREIDRLKAELQRLHSGHPYQKGRENQDMLEKEDLDVTALKNFYEQELSDKSKQLQEALVKMEVMSHSLKETEKRLQLKEATLKGLGFQVSENEQNETLLEKEQLRQHIKVMESKLSEKEMLIHSADQTCRDLQALNEELQLKSQESERTFNQMLIEAKEEIRMLQEKVSVEVESDKECRGNSECQELMQAKEEMIQEVLEGFKRRSDALYQVLGMLMKASEENQENLSSVGVEEEGVGRSWAGMVKVLFERDLLSRVLDGIESSQTGEGDFVIKDVVERMLAENKIQFSKMKLFTEQKIGEPLNAGSAEHGNLIGDQGKMTDDGMLSGVIMKELTEAVQSKVALLNQIALSSYEPGNDLLIQSLPSASFTPIFASQQGQWIQCIRDAVLDVTCNYLLIRQKHQQKIELQSVLDASKADCANCFQLKEQNMELKLKLEQLLDHQNPISDDLQPVTHIQIEGEPIDSLDKAIQLQDTVAKHKKELRELREVYEKEAVNLRQEVAKAGETLRLRSEENVKEIDSLTVCMENLKEKHETERNVLVERFNQELTELHDALGHYGADLAEEGKPDPASIKQQIQKLVAQVSLMTEEMKRQDRDGEAALLRLKYAKDLENLKATCERGFAAMEESHQKVIDELQRKHQRELENLHEEKERLLAEETAATIAAIEAMKNAHRNELEKELDKARKANSNTENADIEEIRRQHEEELLSFQREIEVLSEQYSQKCLENAHLAQALEAERQALRQCQRENQELNAHNQELNNRLAAEITKMRSMASEDGGEAGTVIQGKELYELEVMLRVKESEVQYLKQEINSLKDELQTAQRDKKYATDKYKDIYTELSIVKAKAERDLGRLRDQLQLAHEALGEPSPEEVQRGGYDIMKSKSNPDILKMAAVAAKRSERAMRSKSLKEGLTAEQRLHLFDNKDTKEF